LSSLSFEGSEASLIYYNFCGILRRSDENMISSKLTLVFSVSLSSSLSYSSSLDKTAGVLAYDSRRASMFIIMFFS